MRQTSNGETGTFATAAGSDRGVILQVHGAEMIGACFYVVPFRGTTDFGVASNKKCVIETEHARLAPNRYETAHSSWYDDASGCKSPSSNPGGYNFVYGSISKQHALGELRREHRLPDERRHGDRRLDRLAFCSIPM